MATNVNSGETEHMSLSKLFETGYRLHTSLQTSSEPTNSEKYQLVVKKAVSIFEDTTRKISALDLFSRNEEISEIATNDIKYLLLPALLGSLTLRLNTESRAEVLRIAEIYLKDFLTRVKDYGVAKIDEVAERPNIQSNAKIPDLLQMTRQREDKIKKFKDTKEMETKISDLKNLIESPTVDEEVKRDYYLTLVKWWTQQALDDLDAIQMEKPFVERMASEGQGDKQIDRPKTKPLKPIIITKNEVQKKVYGLGYPSIPTMTVDEFYEQKVREGTFSVPDMSLQAQALGDFDRMSRQEMDEIEEEKGLDAENPDTINRLRGWDDWKDDNRRGCGNRKNMG